MDFSNCPCYFYSQFHVVREHTVHNLNLFRFLDNCFIVQNAADSIRLSDGAVQAYQVHLWWFCLLIIQKVVSKSTTIIVYWSNFTFCFMYFEGLWLDTWMFMHVVPSWLINPSYHQEITFIPGKMFCSEIWYSSSHSCFLVTSVSKVHIFLSFFLLTYLSL